MLDQKHCKMGPTTNKAAAQPSLQYGHANSTSPRTDRCTLPAAIFRSFRRQGTCGIERPSWICLTTSVAKLGLTTNKTTAQPLLRHGHANLTGPRADRSVPSPATWPCKLNELRRRLRFVPAMASTATESRHLLGCPAKPWPCASASPPRPVQ